MSEVLDVVNEYDEVIGKKTRKEIHSDGSWHRGVHILLFSNNELLLPVRSPKKDKFPNCYDVSVSEHVEPGEDYIEAAKRGLKEELNIEGVELKKLLKFRMNYGLGDNMISELYEAEFDGKISFFDKEEIQEIKFYPLDEIKRMLKEEENKFASWTKEILKWYFGFPSNLEILEYSI